MESNELLGVDFFLNNRKHSFRSRDARLPAGGEVASFFLLYLLFPVKLVRVLLAIGKPSRYLNKKRDRKIYPFLKDLD